MRPPALTALPSTSPLPQHTPDPQDLKGNWQQDVQESGDVVGISHPHLQTGRHDGDVLPSALKGRGGPHFGGKGWADTDLVPRHIDGVSLAFAKTCGGPVGGCKVGPEPTLLVAVDGEIEDTRGREKKEVGVEESVPPETPNPQLPQLTQPFIHSLINFPMNSLIHTFIHSSIQLPAYSSSHALILPFIYPLPHSLIHLLSY